MLGIWFGSVTLFPLPVSSWHAPPVSGRCVSFSTGPKAQHFLCPDTLSREWVAVVGCRFPVFVLRHHRATCHPCVSKPNDATLHLPPGAGHAHVMRAVWAARQAACNVCDVGFGHGRALWRAWVPLEPPILPHLSATVGTHLCGRDCSLRYPPFT